MRKSKKRVIAIITCCFVICTFCIGVFADETTQEDINPDRDRIGTILTTTPFDLGDLIVDYTDNYTYTFTPGYYIVKLNIFQNYDTNIAINTYNIEISGSSITHLYFFTNDGSNYMVCNYIPGDVDQSNYSYINSTGTYYIYVYFGGNVTIYNNNSDPSYSYIEVYSISDRSVIDSVYSNSQDVNSSIVSVINEATNVITTNDVVMMFCILIPVISFGVGILIRLRKRA